MENDRMIELARPLVEGEEVLAAGMFQPRGTQGIEGLSTGMAARGFARARAKKHGMPRLLMLAVTPTRLFAFELHSATVETTSMSLAKPKVKGEFARWDRSAIEVAVDQGVTVRKLEVRDLQGGKTYELETYYLPNWGNSVIDVLTEGSQVAS